MKTILAAAAEGDTGTLDVSPLAIGQQQLNRLLAAVENGDDTAVEQLVQLAVDAAERVDWVRRAKPEAIAEVAKRRTDFPAVFTYRKSEWKSRCKELGALPLAKHMPFKPSGKKDECRMIIERCWSLFEIIRRSGVESWDWPNKEIGARIITLSPLSNDTASVDLWADCMRDYWFAENPDWRSWGRGTFVRDKADRGLGGRQTRRVKNQASEPGTLIGEASRETQAERLAGEPPTDADAEDSFRDAIKVRLLSILKQTGASLPPCSEGVPIS